MEQILIYLALIIFGLCMGSFAGASVWRLRIRQLQDDRKNGEQIDKKEYAKLHKIMGKGCLNDRSCCLDCGYRLRWYDLLPVVSWIFLIGRCRKCHSKIGFMEPLVEVGVALYFVASYMILSKTLINGWSILGFVVWLIAGVILAILFIYDLKWSILPDQANFMLIGLGLLGAVVGIIQSSNKMAFIASTFFSVLILSGVYLFIYLLSRGRWIGFGDVKLGLGLGLLLADWQLAFLALFAANLIGCLIVLPGVVTGKLSRSSRVPFGPLLIAGFVIAGLFGGVILNWYLSILL